MRRLKHFLAAIRTNTSYLILFSYGNLGSQTSKEIENCGQFQIIYFETIIIHLYLILITPAISVGDSVHIVAIKEKGWSENLPNENSLNNIEITLRLNIELI